MNQIQTYNAVLITDTANSELKETTIQLDRPPDQIREDARKRQKKQRSNYINNKDLYNAAVESLELGYMTDRFAQMLQLLCKRYASDGSYIGYSWNEDMQAYAMMMLVQKWDKFKPEKSSNAFAYYTECIKRAFWQYLGKEKKQRNIRDEYMIKSGLNPSYSYQIDTEGTSHEGDSGFED